MKGSKKISPQAILALKEALAVIFWKKEDLRDFLKMSLTHSAILSTINWNGTKRETVKELVSRMTSKPELFTDDLVNLILAVSDLTDFSHLDFWDEDGSKRKKAKQAVEHLRSHTKGYIQITQEQEQANRRRKENEEKIAKHKSLESELSDLKSLFFKLSNNSNFQQRGLDFEKFLNSLFHLYELDPKGSFKNYGEQIDGAFTFDGTDYLLEAKWSQQVNRSDLASFTYKVDSKLKIAMGLLITVEGLTPEAISPDFKSIIIMDGIDIMAILEGRVSLIDLLYKKRRKANETGKIYVPYGQL
ncbi:hypothetical protein [Marinoscillum sp. MHG1-6]|uniref:hypothetical protein n=1 Tax=Marinoscillum sp. MHG1-6 TaxID=2959627 RepID=UPI0021571E3F|nr:hypothetical protein [Marinoscillum sp. MHG1-6]